MGGGLPKSAVVHVDTDPGWRGGQSLLQRLVLGLVERGRPTIVACPPQGRLYQSLQGRVPCLPIAPGRAWSTPTRLRGLHPAMLVAHTSHAHGLCLALPRVPLIVHRWVDAPPARTPWSQWKYARVQHFVACSASVSGVLVGAGVPENRVTVVYGGVDAPTESVVAAADAPEVLAVGACVEHKGHDVLAAAVRRLRTRGLELDVAVAGTGPQQHAGLRYLGQREDIPALLAGCRVFVHPGRSEGLGMAVVEAMLAGVPVVASRVGGIPEVVRDDGILVPANDPEALAAGLLRALNTPVAGLQRARLRVRRQYSTEQMVDGAWQVYATHLPHAW